MPLRRLLLLTVCLMFAGCKAERAPATDPSARPEPPSEPPATTPPSPPATPRRTPSCAVQDCKTHQIIDDGCVDDEKGGKLCASCVNACP
jgi:hypothetical protein